MIHTTTLRRLDRDSLEKKASRFAFLVWILAWLITGISIKILLDEWYGAIIGFLLGGICALSLTWVFFARDGAREKKLVQASWRQSIFRLYDPIDNHVVSIDLEKPHRAIFIRAKAEQRFLLRLDQLDDARRRTARITLIGQLPLAMPMGISGDAQSLVGFFHKARKQDAINPPYQIKARDVEGNNTIMSLLEFVESHRDHRDNALRVHRGDETIVVENLTFCLQQKTRQVLFLPENGVMIRQMARPSRLGSRTTAEILLALVPPSGTADALLFSIIAPSSALKEFSDHWDMPDTLENRKFALYNDSVQSFVVTRALLRYVTQIDPNNPVFQILRR